MVQQSDLKVYKIILSGLDNAGKSSYLIAIRKKYNFWEKVEDLKPTIKIDYSTCTILRKHQLNLWDMGGQEKFRNIYVNRPIYFEDTDAILYLIDIQDEIRFEESIDYLHELLNIYRDFEYNNEINICFHKFDPEYKNLEEFNERKRMLVDLIQKSNPKMTFRFFDTSIYNIYSLTRALSSSLNKILFLESADNKLKEFAENFSCDYILLFSNKGLIISDYFKDVIDLKEYDTKIIPKLNEDLEFFQALIDNKVKIDEKLDFFEGNFTYVKTLLILTTEGEKKPIRLFLSLKSTREEGNVDLIKSNVSTLLEEVKEIIF